MTSVIVLIPVLSRPHRVEPVLESLRVCEGDVPTRALFLPSPGDTEELDALNMAGADHFECVWPPGNGDWARKINLGYRVTEEPWMLLAADDIQFTPRWADRLLAMAGRKRVIGTGDGNRNMEVRRGLFSPHSLVARSYIDEMGGTTDGTGDVVCELYEHNWPDRELADVARERGEWLMCRRVEILHLHPRWPRKPGALTKDDVYALGVRGFHRDRDLYHERKAARA